jgi:S-adenosylmethionine hydrolase
MDPEQLGPRITEMTLLDWPEATILAHKIDGEVVSVDSFGNLVTNITAEMLTDVPRDERVTVHCDEHETQGIYSTYAEQPPMTLIALVGSSGKLELAIVNDSAKIMLGVGAGVKVTVTW